MMHSTMYRRRPATSTGLRPQRQKAAKYAGRRRRPASSTARNDRRHVHLGSNGKVRRSFQGQYGRFAPSEPPKPGASHSTNKVRRRMLVSASTRAALNDASKVSKSHATQLEIKVREALASTYSTGITIESTIVALNVIDEIADECGPYGMALLNASELIRKSVFSQEAFTDTGEQAYFTLCAQLAGDAKLLVETGENLRTENRRLQEVIRLQNSDLETCRSDLREERARALNLQFTSSKLHQSMEEDLQKLKAERDEAMNSFSAIAKDRLAFDSKMAKAQSVISELSNFRSRAENLRVRFKRVPFAAEEQRKLGQAGKKLRLLRLATQMKELYCMKLDAFDALWRSGMKKK